MYHNRAASVKPSDWFLAVHACLLLVTLVRSANNEQSIMHARSVVDEHPSLPNPSIIPFEFVSIFLAPTGASKGSLQSEKQDISRHRAIKVMQIGAIPYLEKVLWRLSRITLFWYWGLVQEFQVQVLNASTRDLG